MGVINDAHHLTEVVQTLKQGDIKLSRKMELWRLCVLLALISGIKAPVPLSDNSLSEEDHYKDGQIPTNDVNDGQIPAFDVNDGKISAFDVQDKFDRVDDPKRCKEKSEACANRIIKCKSEGESKVVCKTIQWCYECSLSFSKEKNKCIIEDNRRCHWNGKEDCSFVYHGCGEMKRSCKTCAYERTCENSCYSCYGENSCFGKTTLTAEYIDPLFLG